MKPYHCLLMLLALTSCSDPEPMITTDPEVRCHMSPGEQERVDSWASESYSFDYTDGTIPDEDLIPMATYLADANIVGMGEGTHGTSEFFTFKVRLFQTLVEKAGFKAIVFELPWGTAQVIDEYVTEGKGSAEAALDQSFYWIYNTDEVLELVEWMRNYNASQAPEDYIHFVGNDPQGPHFLEERRILYNYLNGVIPDSVDQFMGTLDQLPGGDLSQYHQGNLSTHQANAQATFDLLQKMESYREDWTAQTGSYGFEVAKFALEIIRQREALYWFSGYGEERDRNMATNTQRWQELWGPDTKVAAWAHNYHVLDGWAIRSIRMGTSLRQEYGAAYKSVGFSFSKGRFNAFLANFQGGFQGSVRAQRIDNMLCGITNQLFEEVPGDQFYLVMDDLSPGTRSYFNSTQSFFQCGAGFNPAFQQQYIIDLPLGEAFDVLVHFDKTTASRLR